MPHSVAVLAALSGLGAAAAHTKAEASLEACFLQTSFVDGGHAAANAAAVSPHICAAPALLKVAGKAASDFFTGILAGVKTAVAGPAPPVCLSAGASPAVSSPAVCTVGIPKAVGTSTTALKAGSSSHATTQLLKLKHHTSFEGAAAGGNRLFSDSFAALNADSARDVTGGIASHSCTQTLPVHSLAAAAGGAGPAAPAVAAPAAAGAGAPTVGGAVASVGGAAAKTNFAYKGAAWTAAQHKGALLSKTAVHGGHHTWKTRSSFLGRKRGGGTRGADRAQKQAAKEARQRQKQMQRQEQKQQQQLQRQQRKQQQREARERRGEERARNRAYREERAQSRARYRQERDRLKQEQRQLRSLTRNEQRLQREQEQLARARARSAYGPPAGGAYYGPSGPYGAAGPYGSGYDHYGYPYGGGSGYYGGEMDTAGGYGYGADGYGSEAYGDHELAAAGTTQHVYAHPGAGEGLKSVTVVQDVAETKGGVTLHHVTETTSRARDVVAPQHEEMYTACCFMQLRGFTGARIPRWTWAAPLREQGSGKAPAASRDIKRRGWREAGGGWAAAVAVTGIRTEAADRAGGAGRLPYTEGVTHGCLVAAAPLQGVAGPVTAAGWANKEDTTAGDTHATKTTWGWMGHGPASLHAIREEDNEDQDTEGEGEEAPKESIFLRIKREACSLLMHPCDSLEEKLQPLKCVSASDSVEGLRQQQQRMERGQQQQRTQQLLRWEQEQFPQGQRRDGDQGQLLWRGPNGSSRRLFAWVGVQRVRGRRIRARELAAAGRDEEKRFSAEEAGKPGIKRPHLWNTCEHPEEAEIRGRTEGEGCCGGNASGLFVTGVKVSATEMSSGRQHTIAASGTRSVLPSSSGTAAAGGGTATAAADERDSQPTSLSNEKEGADNSGDTTDIATSPASTCSSTVTAEPPTASKNKHEGRTRHFEEASTVDDVGKRDDHSTELVCCADLPSTNRGTRGAGEGSTPGKDLSVEGESSSKEDRLTKGRRSRSAVYSVDLRRPNAREWAAVRHPGACATAVDYPENVTDSQASFVSVTTVPAHVSMPAANAFPRSRRPAISEGLQHISGRRVQLSFLPFRKLLYSNFF